MKFPHDRILKTMQGNNLKIILVMLIPCIPILITCSIPKTEKEDHRPVDLVYPFLDTANSRWFFFSSACRPFGMVNLSPDTQIDGDWGTGYRYNTDTV